LANLQELLNVNLEAPPKAHNALLILPSFLFAIKGKTIKKWLHLLFKTQLLIKQIKMKSNAHIKG
jgi:hypothetical protein